MRNKRKISSFLITIVLVTSIVGFALARTEDFNDFIGEGHGSCHGNITQSSTGYITILSSSGLSVNPSETFTVSIQIFSFTEAQGTNIVAGFPSGSPGRADNKDFTFVSTQQSVSIDGSGDSLILDFQVTAPAIAQTYTLHADAIYRAGGSASYFAHGDLILAVEIQNTPPQFNNLIESSDPLELGQQENLQVDVTDSETSVSGVFIELAGKNYTMTNTLSNTYEFNWTPSIIGVKNYVIYANDTDRSWNSISGDILVIDTNAPILSNLVENIDPLELGQTETIQINATDLSGVDQVLIKINDVNYSMTNVVGSTWEYNTWTPTSTGLKPYMIYANDTVGNLNSISSDINVIDTTAPTYAFLVESADPLPLGQNETISIKVYDSPGSGIKEILLEYNNLNHTMKFIGFDTWQWSNWKPSSVGIFVYSIYMIDNSNNINTSIGSIEVFVSSGPTIQNLSKSANPLELGQTEIIQVDVDDNDGVSEVLFEIDAVNYTMVHIGGARYEYIWTPDSFGTKFFKIFANDSLNNWNQLSSNINVQDTTPPNFANLTESSDPLELGNSIVISIDATDLSNIKQVILEYDGTNHSMSFIGGNKWVNDTWIPAIASNHQYKIYIQDNANNWNSTNNFIQVIDTTAPLLSNLNESADLLELGQTETITIDIIDFAGITIANIEIDSNNYTMNNIGEVTWQYNWIPNSVGVKSYIIYTSDSNNNWNYIEDNITIVDTSAPTFSNLIENADPLELGDTSVIQVDVFDFSPLNHVLIENEGINYSMTNIGGLTWRFNNWTPNNIGLKFYSLHAIDLYNNTLSIKNNITVLDTLGPTFYNLLISNKTITIGQSITIQVDIMDISNVSIVYLEYGNLNHSMINVFGNTWEYNWIPSSIGDLPLVIYAKDNHNNWNRIIDNIYVSGPSQPHLLISLELIVNFTLNVGIISLIIAGIVIIIRTSRTRRFIK
ncbi:MAG: hypothetical protein ACFE9S_04105 [Candidatus Hermodarchaeota archaeon]